MRLTGQLFQDVSTPEKWISELKRLGYSASVCPVDTAASDFELMAFRQAAKTNDILISEVGAWSNPISPEDRIRKAAISHCKGQLELAERIGALSCVNIAGSLADNWDGPHPDHFHPDTFTLVVDTVREIIDDVKPVRAKYALEMLPWMIPDGRESYESLVKAIDREAFGVHFDPANMIHSPRAYFNNAELIKDFVARLGHLICNVHVRDVRLEHKLSVSIKETVPGDGYMDYQTLLKALHGLGRDFALRMEHFKEEESYLSGAAYIRGIAEREGIVIR